MAGDLVAYNNASSMNADQVMSCWYDQWQHHWSIYPTIQAWSYPIYIDKGKQAFEIVKKLNEAKLLVLHDISDFIKIMGIVLESL